MESIQDGINGILRPIIQADMETICQIELECFPIEEAATPAQLMDRFNVASDLFLGYEINGKIVAFICGTRSNDNLLTFQSMYEHAANGKTLCIHALCVTSNFRRQGIASILLKHYIEYIKQAIPSISVINLIAHDYLIPFYEKAGFQCLGLSSVVQGKFSWYNCQMIL
ncbi:putative N-acetyltransferase C9.02c [Trichoplax sp. H2]|uniref:Serotonin N-acetyltransferase n=1 Tax=Trichoplax adhaerens TaxID=10228 RepID=B3RWU1_TRIAD|nr:hypothetical protein TRIADDRAFT_56876 [Trichoplax adhaerens]EDV25186.1 hypothetical protein TRIADDRAFT_56876 [Trichoplax adhaerens]RDD44595.1 putative N-acetyltransferase C9.02c [Trichoplax sp. H2]|eukprot:XP_002113076.1 hypothetical protein TRIADDRAFT_56876 [Trichoplax adhaerens]